LNYKIQISRSGALLLEAKLTEMYAKMIGAICTFGIQRLENRPQDADVVLACLVRTIDDALQEDLSCHQRWQDLVMSPGEQPIELDLQGLQVNSEHLTFGHGGDGGEGAWPGGGGGGGGSGLVAGGSGGSGAGGACIIFALDRTHKLIDVQPLVTPGEYDWVCQRSISFVDVIAIGGGGGGGGGGGSGGVVL